MVDYLFLDVLASKQYDISMSHQFYRKKTHTNRYLNDNSHYHPTQKIGIIITIATRVFNVSNEEHLD